MPGVVRTGDINSAGGAATRGSSSVLVNGRGIVFPGSPVSPHPCCGSDGCHAHCAATVVGPGSSTVICENKPVIRQGDSDSCGHSRQTGSSNVICG
jgi:uncharacterized Zn-binding protein involved in type VI secretion